MYVAADARYSLARQQIWMHTPLGHAADRPGQDGTQGQGQGRQSVFPHSFNFCSNRGSGVVRCSLPVISPKNRCLQRFHSRRGQPASAGASLRWSATDADSNAQGQPEAALQGLCVLECFEASLEPSCGPNSIVNVWLTFKNLRKSSGFGVLSEHISVDLHQSGPSPRPPTGSGCLRDRVSIPKSNREVPTTTLEGDTPP